VKKTDLYKKPFISGVGGSGMSNIAHFFLEKGIKFFGSDIKKTLLTEKFEKLGNKIFYKQTGENIKKVQPDAFFYSQAIENGEGKSELEEAKKLGIPCFKNAEGYFELFKDKKIIAISGAHGKTTTTALTSIIFEAAGLDPTCIIGAPIKEFADKNFPEGKSFRLGKGDFVIIEACEYNRQFLALKKIFGLVILNIEHDHPDCYKDIEEVKEAFSELEKNIEKDGFLIDLSIKKKRFFILEEKKHRNSVHFKSLFSLLELESIAKNKEIKLPPDILLDFKTTLIGKHNLSNICISFITFLESAMRVSKKSSNFLKEIASEKKFRNSKIFTSIKKSISNFSGANRRQELIGYFDKIPIYDDYAHHPTQVKVTLEAFFEHFKKIAVIFESHQYKRTKELYKDFIESFEILKNQGKLFLFPVYKVPGRDEDSDFIDHRKMGEDIKKTGVDVQTFDSYDDIPKVFEKVSKASLDCILNLGAGPISGKIREFVQEMLNSVKN